MAHGAKPKNRPTHVVAAGGLLEREIDGTIRIAVVRRRRYLHRDGTEGDRVLPKGKVARGECIEATARREVLEETGCSGRIAGSPELAEHAVDGVPKLTLFFRMVCESTGGPVDGDEVAEVLWRTPDEALRELTYDTEREVVRRAYGPA